jgi:hypothetical protein
MGRCGGGGKQVRCHRTEETGEESAAAAQLSQSIEPLAVSVLLLEIGKGHTLQEDHHRLRHRVRRLNRILLLAALHLSVCIVQTHLVSTQV